MSNARKYSADRFDVMLREKDGRAELRVCNTLADSTSVDMERVFEPFYRMDARTADGSGLGLYVVKLMCDRLGLQVSAEIYNAVFEIKILF